MKLLTLFSAVLLLSSTGVNTTMAFQQVAYAETESLSEGTQQSSGEETNNSADQSETQESTEQSSEEQTTSSEATDDSTTASQEEVEETEALPEAETPDSSEDEEEPESENEQVEGFDAEAATIPLTVASEAQLRAILLGESFTDEEGTEYRYEEIANEQSLVLTFASNLALTEPISGIQRTNVTFRSQEMPVIVSQTAAENLMQFAAPVQLTWQGVQQQGIQSAQGLAQTTGASTITFEDTQLELTTTAGRVVNNSQAQLHFKGTNVVTTATSSIPTLFTAERLLVEGQLTINHRSSNATPIFEMNQVAVASQAEISVTRSTNSNTGTVFHMTGTAASLDFGQGSVTTIRQSGAMVSLPNANQDSRLTLATGATLDVGTGQGLSGNSTSTLGEIRLQAGSQLKLSESGTVSGTPAINVGRSFVVENSTADQPTIIEGTRTGTTTGAFIHVRSSEAEVRFGAFTQMNVNQTGPVLTASLADVFVGENTRIDAATGNGFTGSTMVKSFRMEDHSHIELQERTSSNSNVQRFFVRDAFVTGNDVTLNAKRQVTTGDAAFMQLQAANARFISGDNNQMTISQRGAIFTGSATTSELHFGKENTIQLTSGRGLTGSTGSTRRMVVGEETKIFVYEHGTNDNQHFVRLRDELKLEAGAELHIQRTSTRTAEAIRLTRANSQFTMEERSKLSVEVRGIAFYGTTTTNVYVGDNAEIDSKASYGFTGRRTIRSFVTGKEAKISHTEATSGNLTVATGLSDSPFRVSHTFTLGEGAEFILLRERNRNDAGAIRINSTSGAVTLKKGAKMSIQQVGGAFYAPRGASFVMEEGASFYANTSNGFNSSTRRFSQMTIGKNADFHLTDAAMTVNRSTSRPMIDIANTTTVGEDAQFLVETEVNRSELIYFRNSRANLNINGVQRFELVHPTTRAGNSRTTLQRLIRSGTNTNADGLSINFDNQKVSLWTTTGEAPTEEFINVSGTLRINRNSGSNPSWGSFNVESRSRYLSVQNADGSLESLNGVDFAAAISGNNYRRLVFSEPEGLVARIDALSDQSTEITGSMYEDTDVTLISYTNTDGELVELDKNSERIEWGDYRDENQLYRYFRIPLRENERLETETEVSIFLSKPSIETYVDVTARQTVIKGVDLEAYNITLDRYRINELPTKEALDALILQESRAQAANVLTEADMTDDFRIVETDLTREVDEDGSYFAVLEVGNKAYQMTIGIDVTSKLEHMRVTIPTKMVFESLYNTAESNRNFESQAYEIRNQSPLAVDTYVNQLAIDDSASIVLLEAGEDPLDYAESESEEEDPTLTYDDISTPLLRLNLKTEETQIQLYEAMEEQHLVRLEERSRVPISLTGDFYGDYPQWIVDTEADQGGYYEDLLVPKYRIVLRFVPRD